MNRSYWSSRTTARSGSRIASAATSSAFRLPTVASGSMICTASICTLRPRTMEVGSFHRPGARPALTWKGQELARPESGACPPRVAADRRSGLYPQHRLAPVLSNRFRICVPPCPSECRICDLLRPDSAKRFCGWTIGTAVKLGMPFDRFGGNHGETTYYCDEVGRDRWPPAPVRLRVERQPGAGCRRVSGGAERGDAGGQPLVLPVGATDAAQVLVHWRGGSGGSVGVAKSTRGCKTTRAAAGTGRRRSINSVRTNRTRDAENAIGVGAEQPGADCWVCRTDTGFPGGRGRASRGVSCQRRGAARECSATSRRGW